MPEQEGLLFCDGPAHFSVLGLQHIHFNPEKDVI